MNQEEMEKEIIALNNFVINLNSVHEQLKHIVKCMIKMAGSKYATHDDLKAAMKLVQDYGNG